MKNIYTAYFDNITIMRCECDQSYLHPHASNRHALIILANDLHLRDGRLVHAGDLGTALGSRNAPRYAYGGMHHGVEVTRKREGAVISVVARGRHDQIVPSDRLEVNVNHTPLAYLPAAL